MKDTFNRQIDYMRISITDRCNLRCRYCMPEDIQFVDHDKILRYEEFLRLARIFAENGIKKIKVTGGEPLVRKGCTEFIKQLKAIDGIENVTLTTNGVLLERFLPELIEAGIDGINVSLDSLKREKYAKITGRDEFDRVWRGIEKAAEAGLRVKLNCVPIAGNNKDEIKDFFELARTNKIDVRFIEMMPIGHGKEFEPVYTEEILNMLRDQYPDIHEIQEKRGNGPAMYYKGDDFKGSVGFIGAVHHKFCDSCNRIRLTSEGYLKLCLYYSMGVDLRKMLREDASDQEISDVIEEAIENKPKEHHFSCKVVQTEENSCDGQSQQLHQAEENIEDGGPDDEENKNMSQIGG